MKIPAGFRSALLGAILALAFAGCGGGEGGGGGGSATGGTGATGGSGGTAGTGGTGGDGGTAGTGGTGGDGGTAGTGGTAGSGGSGGGAGSGGSGGSEPGSCRTDEDCISFGDQCNVGLCDDGRLEGRAGFCVTVPADRGTPCEDGLFCTVDDACDGAGQCVGGPPNDCGLFDSECATVACDEALRDCRFDPVDDGTSCKSADICADGMCIQGECTDVPKDCSGETTACAVGACNPGDGTCVAVPRDPGTTCTFAGLTQCEASACDGLGACMPHPLAQGTSCRLNGLGQCEVASCNGAGTCAASIKPDGSTCDDGALCTFGDSCRSGACAGTLDANACLTMFTLYSEGFEDCAASGWTFAGTWQCGIPTYGPNARTDSGVIATNLSGDYRRGATWDQDTAISPPIDLSNAVSPSLQFWAWMHTESSFDGFNVSARRVGETGFTVLNPDGPPYNTTGLGTPSLPAWYGTADWRPYTLNLSAYVGDEIELKFGFRSDTISQEFEGVYVDDLRILEGTTVPLAILPATPRDVEAGHPTSMPLQRTGGSSAATWSIVGGTNHGWLTIDPSTGILAGTPSPSNAGPFSVTVRVEEPVFPNFAEGTFLGTVIDYGPYMYFRDDIEASCAEWTVAGEWQCGTPTSGPNAAFSGTNVLATNLAGQYPNNKDWSTDYANSPPIELPAGSQPILRFKAWMTTEANWDGFNIKISTNNGVTFSQIMSVTPAYNGPVHSTEQGWSGQFPTWRDFSADLTAWAGNTVIIRFAFHSDTSNTDWGIYVDDVSVADKIVDPLRISSATLGNAKVGRAYDAMIPRQGGTPAATWTLVSGTNHGWLTFDPATGRITGTPTAADIGPVQLVVRVQQPTWPSNFDEKTLSFEVLPVPFGEVYEDLFSNCSAWTTFGDWQCGNATSGPNSCRSPGGCIATNLSGNYADNRAWGSSHATSTAIDLSTASDPRMTFWAWVHTESANLDIFNVKISRDGGAFTAVADSAVSPVYNGSHDGQTGWGGDLTGLGWRQYSVDIGQFAGSSIRVRFDFNSDGSVNRPGIYVDDLRIEEKYVTPLQIVTASLPNNFATVPYAVTLTKSGGSRLATWSILSGPAWLQVDATGRLSGTPTTSGPQTVTVRVEEPLNPANFAERTFSFAISDLPTGPYHAGDFSPMGGWTVEGEWEIGPSSSGPGPCLLGGDCLATRLAENYGNNATYATSIATSPTIDLTTSVNPILTFMAWVKTTSATSDAFNVKVSRDGGAFVLAAADTVQPAYTGTAGSESSWGGDMSTWRRYSVDLTAFVGSTIQIRFAFRSGTGAVDAGVYIDDLSVRTRGLMPLAITTATLPSAVENLRYAASLQRTGAGNNVVWSIVSGTNHGWMNIDPATGTVSGIPGTANVGTGTVRIRVAAANFPSLNFAERDFPFVVEENQIGVYADDRFNDCSRWTLAPASVSDWQCGEATSGPNSCRSAGGCLATNLSGNYNNNRAFASAHATTAVPIDLTSAQEPMLVFWAWMNTESSFDGFNVKISRDGGANFTIPTAAQVSPAYSGTLTSESSWWGNQASLGWRKFTIDIRSFAGSTILIRFAFRSDGSGVNPGVYIDDMKVMDTFADPLAMAAATLPNGVVGIPWTGPAMTRTGGSPNATWSIASGPAWMQINPQTGRLSGTPTADGAQSVTVRISEPMNPGNFAERTFTFEVTPVPAGPYYTADFSPTGGWTIGGEWEMGVASSGPGSCRSGGNCLATRLAGDYQAGATYAASIATSPVIDLTHVADPLVNFWVWMQTESGQDAFNLKVSANGGAYSVLTAVSPAYTGSVSSEQSWSGSTGGWMLFSADLGAYVGSQIQLRFAFRSNASVQFPGVYIDDLRVQTRGLEPITVFSNDLPPTVPTGVPLTASFAKTGGTTTADAIWSFTPINNAGWLSFDPVTHRISGTATAANAGPVSFSVRAESFGFPSNFAVQNFTFQVVELPAGVSYVDDLEEANNWTLRGNWQYGTPTVVGPATCHSGTKCLGTNLSGNASGGLSVSANYINSPPIVVPPGAPSRLTFRAWIESSQSTWGWFQTQILRVGEPSYTIPPATDVRPAYQSTGSNWGGDLSQLGWRKYSVDLSAYAGQTIRVAFMFSTSTYSTTATNVGSGAYVDDVMVETADTIGPSIVEDRLASAYPDVPYTQRMKKTQGPVAPTWSITGGVNHHWLTIDPATGVLSGTPVAANLGPVMLVVRAEDPANPALEDERVLEFEVSANHVYYATGFEGTCPNGWTLAQDWECGVPTTGPGSAYGGTNVLATRLGGVYGSSRAFTANHATSPDIDLTTATAPVAYFRMWLQTEGSTFDGAHLEASRDGGAYQTVTTVTPSYPWVVDSTPTAPAWGGNHVLAGWRLVRANLAAFAGGNVKLRFALRSDGSLEFDGAYVDDLVVVEEP